MIELSLLFVDWLAIIVKLSTDETSLKSLSTISITERFFGGWFDVVAMYRGFQTSYLGILAVRLRPGDGSITNDDDLVGVASDDINDTKSASSSISPSSSSRGRFVPDMLGKVFSNVLLDTAARSTLE